MMDYYAKDCPCGGNQVPILYGLPTTAMIEHARAGIIALGGKRIQEYTHYCYSCNELFTEE